MCKHLLQTLKISKNTAILLQYRMCVCCTYLMMMYTHVYILPPLPFYLIFPEDVLFMLKHIRECLPCIQLE